MKGILLLAHGSRDPQWIEPFELIRAEVERRVPECPTAIAYLEHSTPDLMTAVDGLVTRGTTLIEVVPLFLGAGRHVRNDVPQLVERAMRRHVQVSFAMRPFIGQARAVIDAIAGYAASGSSTLS